MADELTAAEVRHVARLSRLALSDEAVERHRGQLGAILGYMDRLRELDIEGVEPMAHPDALGNRWDDDEVSPSLPNETLMQMAPDACPPFIRVPRVLDGGGGA